VFAGLGSSISFAQLQAVQTPLDQHIEGLRALRTDALAVRFVKDCGRELDGVSERYAFANDDLWTWHAVSNLPEAYDKRVMHLIATAEIWKLENQLVVEEWKVIADEGSFTRNFYCFDKDRKLQMLDTTNFEIPVDGTLCWGMHLRWTKGPNGAWIEAQPFHFIGPDEQPISPPKLTKDDKQIARHWSKKVPMPKTIDGLKLPVELLQ
jgi:hypothetical protein